MKKLFIIIVLMAMLSGCSYGKLIKEDIAIDMTKPFDPMSVITDLKEGTSVEYQIDEDNSMLLVDITFKGKVQHIEKEAELLYPQYSLKDNIVLDLVNGISQDDFITVEDGVEVSYELNENDNSIVIFLNKGIWSKEIVTEANIIHPEYSIKDEVDISTFPGFYRVDDILSAEEGVDIKSRLDKERGIITVQLSKGEWSTSKDVKVNFIDPTYPLRYIAVETWYDDYQQPSIPDEYIEFQSDKAGMVAGKGNIANSRMDFTYSQDTGKFNLYNLENTFWYKQEVNCDSEYNRPNYKEITQWKQDGLNYCRFVSNISYNGEIVIDDGYLYFTYYTNYYSKTIKFSLE